MVYLIIYVRITGGYILKLLAIDGNSIINRAFYGIKLHVTEAVHLPRPETETVALEAVRLINERGYGSVLDLMTGSGW